MSKTVYPYAEAREQGFALFRSSKSKASIYAALHAHGKKHGEKWTFKELGEIPLDGLVDDAPPLYRLEKVS